MKRAKVEAESIVAFAPSPRRQRVTTTVDDGSVNCSQTRKSLLADVSVFLHCAEDTRRDHRHTVYQRIRGGPLRREERQSLGYRDDGTMCGANGD